MDQTVETNTYQMKDSEVEANIISDCNQPYGQSQIFKGSLEQMNRIFIESSWVSQIANQNVDDLLKLPEP